MLIDIPAFVPQKMIHAPEGSMHFRLKAEGAALDFDNMMCSIASAETANLELTDNLQPPVRLHLNVPLDSPLRLILILGIEFMQITKSGEQHSIKDASFNAAAVVAVS